MTAFCGRCRSVADYWPAGLGRRCGGTGRLEQGCGRRYRLDGHCVEHLYGRNPDADLFGVGVAAGVGAGGRYFQHLADPLGRRFGLEIGPSARRRFDRIRGEGQPAQERIARVPDVGAFLTGEALAGEVVRGSRRHGGALQIGGADVDVGGGHLVPPNVFRPASGVRWSVVGGTLRFLYGKALRVLMTAGSSVTELGFGRLCPAMRDALIPPAVGCLLVTHFPVRAELRRRPELVGQPLLVTDGRPTRPLVVDASLDAAGVRAGQTVAAALSRCGGAVTLAADWRHLDEANSGLLEVLRHAAPAVEPAGYGHFYLDVAGLSELEGGIPLLAESLLWACDAGWRPRLGLAQGKFPAFCAAAQAPAGSWRLAPADAGRWLAGFPLGWLPLERRDAERLAGFGCRSLGDVARMPEPALVDYLGPCGRRIRCLAMGVDDDPVVPVAEPESYTERLEFPFPVDTIPGLEAGLRSLAERVWRRAGLDGRRVGEAHLSGSLDAGGVWQFGRGLRNPAASADGLCRTLSAVLGACNWPSGALTDMTLMVGRLSAEAGRQDGLWRGTPRPVVPDIPGVERLAVVDAASPLPERRWAIGRSLRPLVVPAPAEVECVARIPHGVRSGDDTWRRVERVTELWEVDTAWWTGAPERRRYWVLVMAGGGSVTVYRDLRAGGWYRQGG